MFKKSSRKCVNPCSSGGELRVYVMETAVLRKIALEKPSVQSYNCACHSEN